MFKTLLISVFTASVLTSLHSLAAPVSAKAPDIQESPTDLGSSIFQIGEYLVTEEPIPKQGLSLGIGWNRALGQKMSARCVIGEELPIKGDSYDLSFYDAFDREQITRALNVSAKASYAGVASGSAQFSRNVKIDNSKRNIFAVVAVDKGGFELAPPKLKLDLPAKDSKIAFTPAALGLLLDKTKKPAQRLSDFQRMCGDSFVGTIRQGGRLAAMFNYDQTDASFKETFNARASGGFGGFKGGGSLSSSIQTEIEKASTEVKVIQEGGVLTVELTAKAVLDKIKGFPSFASQLPTDNLAMLVPYQTLPDWPRDLDNLGISDLDLQSLSAHGSRLLQLGKAYADAATNPSSFYFPFAEGSPADAAKKATGLYAAASCIEGLAAQCSIDSSCNYLALSTVESVKQYCPNLGKSLNENDASVAFSLVLSNKSLLELNEQSQKSGKTVEINGISTSKDIFSLRNIGEAKTAWSIYDMYYKLLAQAPLSRTGKDESRDQAYQVSVFCSTLGVRACDQVSRTALANVSVSEADKALRIEIYQRWVLVNRLAPLASSFCNMTPKHPMCRDPVALLGWSGELNPVFGADRNFTKDATQPPAQVKPVPVIPLPVFCGHALGHSGRCDM